MGLEDIYSTRLTLSLGSDDLHRQVYRQNKRSKPPSPISDNYLPSLSLGLPWEVKFEAMNDGSTAMMMNCCLQQASPAAAPSSFSDSSLKREREISGGEEDELEAAEKGSPCRDEYQDDEEVVGTRKKLRLTKQQSIVLEDSFKQHTTLNSKQKQELARRLNLRPRQVEVWFQNRRARTKLKQTEVDYEVLRKCYETLTDENRRLQKELLELKAAANQTTTAAPPFHMAATLTMCPSCERTYGGSTDSSAKFSISAGGKSHLFRSFLNPSEAC
ncbi:PREDICTED: homeobox-leucine zipper protein HAT22-like [Ipomoea nil]|uniref:homeobox-leucine zipper protein HAT22-like n=1 Tax=Ipomoea nil TaxID=35883 RepID=UPI000901EBDB|nr:PREDICTED: homeobox-leucine zipper protein HAT22-like [Ipomoea nil]